MNPARSDRIHHENMGKYSFALGNWKMYRVYNFGTSALGSLIAFINFLPNKNHYFKHHFSFIYTNRDF